MTDADLGFLLGLYDAGRAAELDLVDWPDGQREAFVRMQYELQDRQYRATHPDGDFDIVEVDGRPVGRITVARGAGVLLVVDIAIVPGERGRGLGTRVLGEVLSEADDSGREVRMHVALGNPAARLYERLGFRAVDQQGAHRHLVWKPSGTGSPPTTPGACR